MNFKISPKKETDCITHLVNNLAGRNILIQPINKTFYKSSKKELYQKVKRLHKNNGKKFREIKSIYKKIWKKNGKKYLKELEKIIGNKLNKNKTCYIVPSLWMNIADVIGRKNAFFVAEKVQQVPLDYLLFHELTHLYYADEIVRLNLLEAGKSPMMEGVDHLILFKSPIRKFFSKPDYEEERFVKSNPKFMKELEKTWYKRKDFESFLKDAIKVQRKIKGVVIC